MESIRLLNGVLLPVLGLGVYQTPDGEQTQSAVRWALEAGYRHIDTAMIYGNERGVGQGIRDSGVPREQIFLTTKLWNDDIRGGRAREALERSLADLDTDYVDLYLIHWPVAGYETAWAALEDMHAERKIRAIGVSNFQRSHLDNLARTARTAPAVNQIESHPYFNNQMLIDHCLSAGIAVEVWSPLGGTGGTLLRDETLTALATKYGRTPAQIVLRWDVQRGVAVLPKSTHRDRIISNMEIFDFDLSDADMAAIQALDRGQRVGPDPDNFDF